MYVDKEKFLQGSVFVSFFHLDLPFNPLAVNAQTFVLISDCISLKMSTPSTSSSAVSGTAHTATNSHVFTISSLQQVILSKHGYKMHLSPYSLLQCDLIIPLARGGVPFYVFESGGLCACSERSESGAARSRLGP